MTWVRKGDTFYSRRISKIEIASAYMQEDDDDPVEVGWQVLAYFGEDDDNPIVLDDRFFYDYEQAVEFAVDYIRELDEEELTWR